MKDKKRIIFSVGKHHSDIQFKVMVGNLRKDFDLKIASYFNKLSQVKYRDWILDPLFCHPLSPSTSIQQWINGSFGKTNTKKFDQLFNDIIEYEPDLIIVDFEPILGMIGNALDIPVWNCSTLNLDFAIDFSHEHKSYKALLRPFKNNWYQYSLKFHKQLIYSPFYKFSLPIKNKYEWVAPFFESYSNEKDSSKLVVHHHRPLLKQIANCVGLEHLDGKYCADVISSGETQLLADIIMNQMAKSLNLAPNLTSLETMINANVISLFGLGYDLGQIELMGNYAKSYLDEIQNIPLQYSDNTEQNLIEKIKSDIF
jgi:hypothetical protein